MRFLHTVCGIWKSPRFPHRGSSKFLAHKAIDMEIQQMLFLSQTMRLSHWTGKFSYATRTTKKLTDMSHVAYLRLDIFSAKTCPHSTSTSTTTAKCAFQKNIIKQQRFYRKKVAVKIKIKYSIALLRNINSVLLFFFIGWLTGKQKNKSPKLVENVWPEHEKRKTNIE
jgi:hypothetical protein